jgi:hypothetical protein
MAGLAPAGCLRQFGQFLAHAARASSSRPLLLRRNANRASIRVIANSQMKRWHLHGEPLALSNSSDQNVVEIAFPAT